MDKFGFPTNIKQIGNIDDNIRVYIEDNVYSYLMRLSESREQECIAALIGRCMIIDGKTVLFINGTIQGLYAEMEKGILKFSDLTIEHIEEEREKYFKGLEVVGWLLSQPNYGNFLSTGYINYHKQNFTKPYQVLFVTDPVEKIHTFFNWNETQSDVVESEGFFIYYDRNSDMKTYEESNKIINFEKLDEVELKLLRDDNLFDEDEDFEPILEINQDKEKKPSKIIKLTENETERVIQTINKLSNEKTPQRDADKLKQKPVTQQQKTMNTLVMVSSMMFFITVVLGVGMVKSDDKITELEQEVVAVSTAYNELVNDVLGDTTPVFSNTGSPLIVNAQENPNASINDILDGASSENLQVEPQTEIKETEIKEKEVKEKEVKEKESKDTENKNTEDKDEENKNTENKKEITQTTSTNTTQTSDNYETYTVGEGDTLTSISVKFYGSKDKQKDIMQLNGIEDANKIYYGMVIKLP